MNAAPKVVFAALALALAGCGRTIAGPPPAPRDAGTRLSQGPATAPRRNQFPPTPSGIHLNLVFNYLVKYLRREIGLVDVVWGSQSPLPRGIDNQFYTPFERDGPYGAPHNLKWWKAHHPDWIEYRCDRKTVAFEFGERLAVPIDIADPAALAYQRSAAVDPALNAGYRAIDFDNLELGNYWHRCGHFSAPHRWASQYTGQYQDPAYTADVLAWAKSTFAFIHNYSRTATMAINFSYDANFGESANRALATSTDEVLDEGGFTNYGTKHHNVTTPRQWRQIVGMIRTIQASGGCYMENGEEPALSKDISQEERLWVVANYLLIRDDCTYVWISGFTASGGQDYGRILIYPEYGLTVGAPSGAARETGGAWQREYTGGLALVNPSYRRVTIPLKRTYVDENGRRYRRSITLTATSGQILLLK
ncbi:MAG TPA: putative glycoside hydrolase [Candidatus Cybelea sp.]